MRYSFLQFLLRQLDTRLTVRVTLDTQLLAICRKIRDNASFVFEAYCLSWSSYSVNVWCLCRSKDTLWGFWNNLVLFPQQWMTTDGLEEGTCKGSRLRGPWLPVPSQHWLRAKQPHFCHLPLWEVNLQLGWEFDNLSWWIRGKYSVYIFNSHLIWSDKWCRWILTDSINKVI